MNTVHRDTDSVAVCPFERSHMVTHLTLDRHIMKCARNHRNIKLVRCPFNIAHRVKETDLREHMMTCTDRHAVTSRLIDHEDQKVNKCEGNSEKLTKIHEGELDENWDAEEGARSMKYSVKNAIHTTNFKDLAETLWKNRIERQSSNNEPPRQNSDKKRTDPVKISTARENCVAGSSKAPSANLNEVSGKSIASPAVNKKKTEVPFQMVKSKKLRKDNVITQIKKASNSKHSKKKLNGDQDKQTKPNLIEEEREPAENDPVKLERKIRKKLNQIEKLKQLKIEGKNLSKEENEKLLKEAELLEDLQNLSLKE